MAQINIDTKPFKYPEVLSHFEQLEVPTFQRPYNWQAKDQVATLWSDLFCSNEDFWLLGNLVLCGQKKKTDPDLIIDGQQRLTTLTILTAALRDRFYEIYASGFDPETAVCHPEYIDALKFAANVQEDFIQKRKFSGKPGPLRLLKSKGKEEEWFRKRIQKTPKNPSEPKTWGEASKGCDYKPPMAQRDSSKTWSLDHKSIPRSTKANPISAELRNMWKAYNYFQDQIKAETNCNPKEAFKIINNWLEYLAECVYFITTKVEDDVTAYVLFETLNDRGMDLSVADLFKNLLFQKAVKEEVLDKTRETWAHIVAVLDHGLIPDFLRHKYMVESGEKVSKRSLFQSLKGSLTDIEVFHNYLDVLEEYSNFYAEITLAPDKNTGPEGLDEDLREDLRIFSLFSYTIVNPLLLSAWNVTSALGDISKIKERKKFLRLTESFMFHYTTLGGGFTNKLESSIPAWSKELTKNGIDGYTVLEETLSQFLNEQRAEGSVKNGWDGFESLIASQSVSKAILYRLNQSMIPEPRELRENLAPTEDVHLEHIYPQKPSDDAINEFKADKEIEVRDVLTKRLGNMCLLWSEYNKEASNKSFSVKRDIYKNSKLLLTKKISELTEWGEDAIDKQEAIYLTEAKKIWHHFG